MDISLSFSDVTHVVIKTGYAPPLSSLLEIENALREEFVSEVAVLFSCATTKRLGVLVPCPFGFLRPAQSADQSPGGHLSRRSAEARSPASEGESAAYVAVVNDAIDRIVRAAVGRPFYEQGLQALKKSRDIADAIYREQRGQGARVDLYEDIREEVEAWAAQPRSPERPMDCQAFREVVEEAALRDDWACAPPEEDGAPLMSYDDRLREAKAVVEALGGLGAIEGTLCLKMDGEDGVSRVAEVLRGDWFSYCVILGLTAMRYVVAGQRRILVLEYDAERG